MNYVKRILSVIMVMSLTAFAAPALAQDSSPASIVGPEGHLAGEPGTSDYSSPVSLVGSRGHAVSEPSGSVAGSSSPVSLVGAQGHVPEQVASTRPADSGFDWTDGLLGLVAGISLAAMALAAARVVRGRRPAASGA